MKTKRNNNSNFRTGVVICLECGKHTRDTGAGEGQFQMCANCIQANEWANGISDGSYTIDDVPEKFREMVKRFL